MKLSEKIILLISPEPWDHIFVSKHHYAVCLAERGNKVYFLGPPSDDLALCETAHANLFLLKYKRFPRGLRFYPPLYRRKIILREYKALESLCGQQFDVVWSFDNSVFFDFKALPSGTLKISHIVDLNQNFQTAKAATTADYCFCTTDLIKRRLSDFNSRVFKIPHGYFATAHSGIVRAPRTRPLVIYAGNLAMPYIDWVLLLAIVRENPEADFLFIGPDANPSTTDLMSRAKQNLIESQNCAFIGRVDSQSLHKHYRHADLFIVAYQEKFHDDQANPHKMMEYLGSGQMIVATYTAEYVDLCEQGLLRMSRSNADFPLIFSDVLGKLAYWNSQELQMARRAIALSNTYVKQIERIERIINN